MKTFVKTSVKNDVKNMSPAITVKNLSVSYANGLNALTDASFAVPSASITALVGVNGAGKSTLFKALMGLVPHQNGQITILGQSVRAALAQKMIAYVPQAETIDWSFPVLVQDVVMMGRYGHMGMLRIPRKVDHEKVDEALHRVDLINLRHRQIGELSGGQKKRLFLARALAQDAQVILLDEPFSGVDVKTEDMMIELLTAMRDSGRVMLIATHNLGSVPEFCDHSVLINQRVLAFGKTAAVFTQKNLEAAFGGVLRQFVLGGADLHTDGDKRSVTVITDDERPIVIYDEAPKTRPDNKPDNKPDNPPDKKAD